MKKKTSPVLSTGAPEVIRNHYSRLVNGGEREIKRGSEVVIVTERHCSEEDIETMQRILAGVSDFYWKKISDLFGDDDQQIALFDAAWMARINYDEYRFKTKAKAARKKELAEKLVTDIRKNAENLLSGLNNLSGLGYRSVRRIDSNLLQPSLECELKWLIEKAKSFDFDYIHDEEFINHALSSNKNKEKMEYLRGLVSLLSRYGFNLNNKNMIENVIAPLSNAALGIEDVTYNDVYNVLPSV